MEDLAEFSDGSDLPNAEPSVRCRLAGDRVAQSMPGGETGQRAEEVDDPLVDFCCEVERTLVLEMID